MNKVVSGVFISCLSNGRHALAACAVVLLMFYKDTHERTFRSASERGKDNGVSVFKVRSILKALKSNVFFNIIQFVKFQTFTVHFDHALYPARDKVKDLLFPASQATSSREEPR